MFLRIVSSRLDLVRLDTFLGDALNGDHARKADADGTQLEIETGFERCRKFPVLFRDDLEALYPPGSTPEEARASYIRMTTHGQFTCGARRIARAAAASQESPVFRYQFSHGLSAPVLRSYGAYHGLELWFVFQTLERSTLSNAVTDDDTAVLVAIRDYWSQFAEAGDPNGPDLATWSPYDEARDNDLEISSTPAEGEGLETEACDLWDAISSTP